MRLRPFLFTLLLATSAAPAVAAGPASDTRRDAPKATSERAAEEIDRHCLRETGTRIRLRGERRACAPFSGRVWSRDDLDRTGHIDIASALRALDVSIR